jgi:hypothetical protein
MTLCGRLLKDWRYTPAGQNSTGQQVDARFWGRLIVNRSKEVADSYNFVAWGRDADVLNQYATVGKTLLLEGVPSQSNKKLEGILVDGKQVYQNYLELGVKTVVLGPDSEKVRQERTAPAPMQEKTPGQLLEEKATAVLGPNGVALLVGLLEKKVEEQRNQNVSVEA